MSLAVAYYRVSTAAQGRSGLGLEAQQEAVRQFAANRGFEVIKEFVEVESGKRNDRPCLSEALNMAELTGATLLIARLDRLSRNAAFLLTLKDSGVNFLAVDMPEASHLTVGVLALVAQQEREAISKRTKAALAAAKARGKRLGNPNGATALRRAAKGNGAATQALRQEADARAMKLRPTVEAYRRAGITSLGGLAAALNEAHVKTPRGGRWASQSVANLLRRLEALKAQGI